MLTSTRMDLSQPNDIPESGCTIASPRSIGGLLYLIAGYAKLSELSYVLRAPLNTTASTAVAVPAGSREQRREKGPFKIDVKLKVCHEHVDCILVSVSKTKTTKHMKCCLITFCHSYPRLFQDEFCRRINSAPSALCATSAFVSTTRQGICKDCLLACCVNETNRLQEDLFQGVIQ